MSENSNDDESEESDSSNEDEEKKWVALTLFCQVGSLKRLPENTSRSSDDSQKILVMLHTFLGLCSTLPRHTSSHAWNLLHFFSVSRIPSGTDPSVAPFVGHSNRLSNHIWR